MLIWKGYGFLVPVATFITLIITELSVETVTKNENYYQENGWVLLLGFTIAGLVCLVISSFIKKDKSAKIYIEKETGKEVVFAQEHTFFFIDIRHWSILLPLLGLAFMISRMI